MIIIRTVREMQALAQARRAEGKRLALVPTMGALHEGHLSLARTGRRIADHVTVSIFVNPTQFGPGEDFGRYPRTLKTDVEALRAEGLADVIFAPPVEELYPFAAEGENLTWVTVDSLGDSLCGAYRPGHFRGVTTVVSRLFNACRPDVAVFGLKDAQQFLIIRRMAEDLCTGIEVVGVETQREPDGLARSSRNVFLTPEERAQAIVLFRAVEGARRLIESGEQHSQAIVESMRKTIGEAPLARLQYAEVVDEKTLQPVDRLESGTNVLAAVAVFFGSTRLIDNAFVRTP